MKDKIQNTSSTTVSPIESLDTAFAKTIDDGIRDVESRIADTAKHDNPNIEQLSAHVLRTGGKQIRARLVLISFLAFSDTLSETALNTATAAELLHTATLLHDDVLDEAQIRRGQETINYIYDTRTALVLGDLLLAKAFQMLKDVGSLEIMSSFIETAQELGEGALTEQIHKDDLNLTEDNYFYIITRKTASFFRTCTRVGGLLSQVSESDVHHLEEFGLNFGIAFQITDDLMDLVSNERTMGKPRGQDILEGNLTLPLIRYFAEDKSNIPTKKLSQLTRDDYEFSNLLEGINADGSLSYSYNKASEYIDKSLSSLNKLPQTQAIDLLRKMTNDLHRRMA